MAAPRHRSKHHGAGNSDQTPLLMAQSNSDRASSATPNSQALPEHPNAIVYRKMEHIVQHMQDEKDGVPVKAVKSFLSKIPSVFTGIDIVQWLMRYLEVEEQAEALHLAHQLACHGYLFPIDDHVLTVKNDNTFYRFQTPYFWPSNGWEPENTDYAVYLCKRTMQNKAHLELEDFEAENLAKLQKQFSRKWEFIFMQAEAQCKVDKKRDRLERQILDSQERAFWDVHRSVPGCVNTTEVDFRKLSIRAHRNHLAVPKASISAQQRVVLLRTDILSLEARIARNVLRLSKVAESYMTYSHQRTQFDPFLSPIEPPNPWIHDSVELWLEDKSCIEPSSLRVRRWALGLDELLLDPSGIDIFMRFLEKEYASENLRFYLAVQQVKQASSRDVPLRSKCVYNEFIGSAATCPVNLDAKVIEITTENLKAPDRQTFDDAVEHISKLMKNDSYQRFLRSEMYREMCNRKKGSTKATTFTRIVPNNVLPQRWQEKQQG